MSTKRHQIHDHARLQQLDALIDHLGQLPASPERDWMIAEVRARKVDVETGVPTGPIRPREPQRGDPAEQVAR